LTLVIQFKLSFSYEFNQDGILPIFIENRGPTQPGFVNYLLTDVNNFFIVFKNGKLMFKRIIIKIYIKQQADLLIGSIGISAIRNKLTDLPYPIYKYPLALMIPKPILETRSNFLNAILQPFQLNVCNLIQ